MFLPVDVAGYKNEALGGSFNPVHVYLLVGQGVDILEFNNLEQLAAG